MVKSQVLSIGICKGSESRNTLLHMTQEGEKKNNNPKFTALEALLLRKEWLISYLPDL